MDGSGGREAAAVSRRAALLAGLSASVLASCAPGTGAAQSDRPDGFSPVLPTHDVETPPPADTSSSPRPVPVRTHPAYQVRDLVPSAPANAVALTIDDGPHPYWTPKVLDLLAHYRIQATFCLVGLEVRAFPQVVRHTVAAGHSVCNHTYTHPQPFTQLTAAQLGVEIGSTQAIITAETGRAPRLFRAPGGGWSRDVFAAAAGHGLNPIDWDVDPRDWSEPGTGVIIRRLLAAKPGDILLCHDGGGDRAETLAALTMVVPVLLGRGLRFVSLDQALA
jgi:peptidoglycan/xylan/chitin deacetylase (PgdA/CDA1 family)